MAKKKKTDAEDTGTEESARPKKRSLFKPILLVVCLLLLSAAAATGWVYYMLNRETPILKSNLAPETLSFLKRQMPELYAGFALLDEEIVLTYNEMTRIEKIAEAFPEQKKIPDTEYKIWESSMKSLQKGQADFEKNIQIIFVSYQVNPETGQALMEEKRDALKENLDNLVSASKPLTDKLRELEAKKPYIQRMKARIFKGTP